MRRLTAFCLVALVSVTSPNAPSQAADAVPGQTAVVYFQEWSAAIDAPAVASIAKAADYAKANPSAPIRVTGVADPTGSKQANVLMSKLRAQVVVDQLVQDGVPARRISQSAKGAMQFALSSQESRRVTIAVGTSP